MSRVSLPQTAQMCTHYLGLSTYDLRLLQRRLPVWSSLEDGSVPQLLHREHPKPRVDPNFFANTMAKFQEADAVQKHMGAFGRYQFRLTLYVIMAKFSIAFYMIAIVFLFPPVDYYCDGDPERKNTCPCENPKFDNTTFERTIATEWNLICDRKWLGNMHQTIFQSGVFSGSLIFGSASDRYGRRQALWTAVVIQLIFATCAIFAPSYWIFTFCRFIVGISVGGTVVTTYVLLMEFIGTHLRALLGAILHLPFNFGHMLLPVIAFFTRDYLRLQYVMLVSAVILLPYFWILPETPRWLLATSKTNEAIKIIEYVAKVNNLPATNLKRDIRAYQREIEKNKGQKKGTMADLFRTPNIRRNIICMAINWVACSYCFYGMSQYVSHLTGNIFLNVLVSASFCALGSVVSIPLQNLMGRKTLMVSHLFITAACYFFLSFISSYAFLSVCMAIIGLETVFVAFVVVFLYTTEVFPTVVRNAAVGLCSMCARVGAMVAPLVINTQSYGEWIPPFLFAIVPLIGAILTLLLPETKGHEYMTTLEEAENFGSESKQHPKTAPGYSGWFSSPTPPPPDPGEAPETKDESAI